MELGALCLTLVAIVLWAGISTRAAVISTPIFFVAIGLVLAEGLHLFDVETDSHHVKIIAEVTLVWVLFADASRIRISDLRADLGRCVRLLGVGLPLTIASGASRLHVVRDQSVVRVAARCRACTDRCGAGLGSDVRSTSPTAGATGPQRGEWTQ
jgi:NhaP-type Na+/H+ or K+/H+ antiporter